MVLIAPSILSADFKKLEAEIQAVEKAGADWIHVDVMDGRFVPNITMGPVVVEAVRDSTKLPVDVHLMIEEPERYIDAFAAAGADRITVHVEACTHLQRTLQHIRSLGKKAGVSLNPATSEISLSYVLNDLDHVLVMTVNPGFSNQAFLPEAASKIPVIQKMLHDAGNTGCIIEVDGGVSEKTIAQLVKAGATAFVAGGAIFGRKDHDYSDAITKLRAAAY